MEQYVSPPWIEDGGDPWKKGPFNPNAFDPAAPYKPKGRTYHFESNPGQVLEDPFDLDNLRIFKSETIQDFLKRLEALAGGSEKKVVAMIGVGGTLAMVKRGNDLVPMLDPMHLLHYAGKNLDQRFSAAAIQFPTLIDSADNEIDYAAELVIAMSWVYKNASDKLKKQLIGFFIPHGTDTMTAGLNYMTMMLGPDCPFSVGYAGAQKTTEDPLNDVAANVASAIESLDLIHQTSFRCRFFAIGGTEGGAFRPWSTKISDTGVRAFSGPKIIDNAYFGIAGLQMKFEHDYQSQQRPDLNWMPTVFRGYHNVYCVTARMGTDPRTHYDHVRSSTAEDAILITSFGAFTANIKSIRAIVQAATERGNNIPIFACSPFPEGSVDHSYVSSNLMIQLGIIPVQLLPDVAIAKIALTRKIWKGKQAIQEFVASNNYAGEQPPSSDRGRLAQSERNQVVRVLVGPTPEFLQRIWHS